MARPALLLATSVLPALLLAPAASAQNPTLVGISSPPAGPVFLKQQEICAAPTVCPSGLGPPSAPYAGGAAWNPAHASLWASDGTMLVEQTLGGCAVRCREPARLSLGTGSAVSGLAVHPWRQELYQLETVIGAAALTIYDIQSCPPRLLSVCRIALPPGHLAAGLALDHRRGLLVHSVFNSMPPTGPSLAFVSRLTDPCNTFCRVQLDTCGTAGPLGTVRDLAVDPCRGILYATDGQRTATFDLQLTVAGCVARPLDCCPFQPSLPGDVWRGLDVRTTSAAPVAQSCFERGCTPCNAMQLATEGDPAVGNASFGLAFREGVGGATAVTFLGAGGCTRGLSFSCGHFFPALSPLLLVLGAVPLTGASCTATANLPLPIPPDWSLCGARVCVQAVVLCPTSVLGLTNALEITVGG